MLVFLLAQPEFPNFIILSHLSDLHYQQGKSGGKETKLMYVLPTLAVTIFTITEHLKEARETNKFGEVQG